MHQVSKEELGGNGGGSTLSSSRAPFMRDGHAIPSRSRRHTFAVSDPLTSVVTRPAVLAAHISNPATRRSSLSPPSHPRRSHPASRRSSTQDGAKRLTEGVSPSQNTPPQTPRTRSQDEKPTSTPPPQAQAAKDRKSALSDGAAVAPPKGKLHVSISEGRGLRPSYDPYVVCQFQQSEYISEGPRHGDLGQQSKDGRSRGHAALPIQRTDSDHGRPMAIPMRSRQSSNSGHSSDPKENGQYVTDPKWEHDAIL